MTSPADRIPAALEAELSRQYDILRLVGRGGMGAVWLARERSLDRLVAIKVLAGADIGVANVRERFRREARIAAKLVHPNIVPLHAFGETPDALYFVMGYVEGETLATRVEREGRLSRSAAQRILEEIADALAFAHREGVVHRDVKPENILLDAKTGRAMLADFGIARIEDAATSVTMTGVAVGTPSYMSPEQAVGAREIDGRSDLYSLGVVGYRMLLGRLPFVAASGQALMAQHAMAKPDDLTLAVPPADRGVASIIMRALEKEPAARWAKAEDFRDELQALARAGTALPEGLERVQMVGTKILFADVAIAVTFYLSALWSPGWMAGVSEDIGAGAWLLILGDLAFLPILGLAWAVPTARKFGWRETLRAMLHPPESWAHWWPRSWRRPDDIWHRLPAPLRRLRIVLDGVASWLVLGVAQFMVTATTGGGAYGDWLLGVIRTPWGIWALNAPTFLALGWLGAEFVRARRKLGVSAREVAELLGLPHLSTHAGWSKPKFARLLASEGSDAPTARPPQTPDELARAIKELTNRLVRMGFLPDDESVSAAESVRAAIEALESEIQLLHARLDPAEGDRLAKRLTALGASDDDAELRPLLEGQQAVWRRLDQRRHDKEARRDRLSDQLVTLWMQLLELDARLSRGAAADPELTGRVQALSRELVHADEAMTEVEQVLKPTPDRPRVTT